MTANRRGLKIMISYNICSAEPETTGLCKIDVTPWSHRRFFDQIFTEITAAKLYEHPLLVHVKYFCRVGFFFRALERKNKPDFLGFFFFTYFM